MLAHRFLGLPRGQHRNSLEGNVGRRVVVTSKNLSPCPRFIVNLTSRNGLEIKKNDCESPRNNSTKPFQFIARV